MSFAFNAVVVTNIYFKDFQCNLLAKTSFFQCQCGSFGESGELEETPHLKWPWFADCNCLCC